MSKEIKIVKLLQALEAIKVYAWDNDKESLATWEKRYEQLTDDAIIADIWEEYCGHFGFRTEHDECDIPDNHHLESLRTPEQLEKYRLWKSK